MTNPDLAVPFLGLRHLHDPDLQPVAIQPRIPLFGDLFPLDAMGSSNRADLPYWKHLLHCGHHH